MSRASSAMRSLRAAALASLKPRLTSSLNRSCSGGSIDQHHQPLGGERGVVGLAHHHAPPVRAEQLGSPADVADVLVLGDGPEPGAVGLLVPVHRIVGPQPRVLVPRVAVGVRRRRDEVDHGSGGGGHATSFDQMATSVPASSPPGGARMTDTIEPPGAGARCGRARSWTGPRWRPTCVAQHPRAGRPAGGAAVPERLAPTSPTCCASATPSWCCGGRRSAWWRPAPTTCAASSGCCRGCGGTSTGRRGPTCSATTTTSSAPTSS